MNYEKKYDEALERARKLKENPQSVFNEYSPKEGDTICDYIFPELKESEDDKIREQIIYAINKLNVPESEKSKLLAWLEKQGEHANFLSKIQVGDKVTRNEAGVLVNLSQLRRVAKPRKKQCEQKFDWSEEDQNALEDVREAVVHYWGGDSQDILLYWLKALKQRIGGEQ